VIDNASGDVIALVGSADYFAPGSGQVNGAWAKRSAGSTLKPFTYLLALERGATPASMVADVRTSFPAADGFYRPENYNRRCYGPVTYRVALGSSLNISAVKVLLAAGGPEALHQRLQSVSLTTLDQPAEVYGPGLTLGNCEARLLELTNAYASLARLGELRTTDTDAVVPRQPDGRPQPLCAFYSTVRCLELAARLLDEGERRPRVLLQQARTRWVAPRELADLRDAELFFLNVNTPEDYERAREREKAIGDA
jgi:penicillin-binding protein 1C